VTLGALEKRKEKKKEDEKKEKEFVPDLFLHFLSA
jgi:hypothetical protein